MPDGSILIMALTESTESMVRANWLISVDTSGDVLWNRILPASGKGAGLKSAWVPAGDGGGFLLSEKDFEDGSRIRRILPDLRAEKGKPFAYALPLSDPGSFQLKALYLPAGMQVSSGGTPTWTPTQDDFGFAKAAIEVTTRGSKDTLSLNIWINWPLKPAGYHQDLATPVRPSLAPRPAVPRNRLWNSALSPLPSGTSLFDLRGRKIPGRTPDVQARGIYWLRRNGPGVEPKP